MNEQRKKELIDALYKIISSTTTTAQDAKIPNNDYFKRRVLGFTAEYEFGKLLADKKITFMDGGFFMLAEKNKRIVYITTRQSDPDKNDLNIYAQLSAWENVHDLFF